MKRLCYGIVVVLVPLFFIYTSHSILPSTAWAEQKITSFEPESIESDPVTVVHPSSDRETSKGISKWWFVVGAIVVAGIIAAVASGGGGKGATTSSSSDED